MKKYFLLLMITIFSLTLVSCNNKPSEGPDEDVPPTIEPPTEDPNFNVEYAYEMFEIFEKVNPYTEDIEFFMYFGYYPQREITDAAVVEALANISETNENGFIEYKGYEFAKVTVINNHYYGEDPGNDKLFQQGTQYEVGSTHYFLVEPICWRILNNPQSNELFLISEEILDSKAFNNISSSVTIDGVVIRPSDYEYCTIRKWLNEVFYNKAFNDEFKSYIQESLNKNEYTYNGIEPQPPLNSTIDKVFLLSYKEATSTLYGFFNSDCRIAKPSDFARANGLVSVPNDLGNSSNWWTRTGFEYTPFYPAMIKYDGTVDKPYYPQGENIGVRPAIKITLQK